MMDMNEQELILNKLQIIENNQLKMMRIINMLFSIQEEITIINESLNDILDYLEDADEFDENISIKKNKKKENKNKNEEKDDNELYDYQNLTSYD